MLNPKRFIKIRLTIHLLLLLILLLFVMTIFNSFNGKNIFHVSLHSVNAFGSFTTKQHQRSNTHMIKCKSYKNCLNKHYSIKENVISKLSQSSSTAIYLKDNSFTNNDLFFDSMQQQINSLNAGKHLNVNSSKQVAFAIFGSDENSTNKIILEQAATGLWPNLSYEKQQLAKLVLQLRKIKKKNNNIISLSNKKYNSSNNDVLQSNNQQNSFDKNLSISSDIQNDIKSNTLNDDSITNSVMDQTISKSLKGQINNEMFDKHISQNNDVSNLDMILNNYNDINSYEKILETKFNDSKNKVNIYWKEVLLQLTKQSSRTLVSQLDFEQCPMGYNPIANPNYNNNNYEYLSSSYSDDVDDNDDSTNTGLSIINTSKTTTAGKKGSFLAFCREQKIKYPDCIILTRCGDFYETFGIDAIILVEHCGLNAMANKAKAGCPIRNIQNTLNSLTNAGFRIAVYEEGNDTDSLSGIGASAGSKSRIKSRFLAQIISPASTTYLYDIVLSSQGGRSSYDILSISTPARPYIGIISMKNGYTLVEVSAEERSVRVSERLTPEAIACRLSAFPPADPLLYVPSMSEFELYKSSQNGASSLLSSLPFLPSRRDSANNGPGSRIRTKIVPPNLVQQETQATSEDIRARNIVVSELLRFTENNNYEHSSDSTRPSQVTVDDFTLVSANINSFINSQQLVHTQPLYLETATQLGLMNDNAIPSLMSYVLPDSAPAATRRFMRRYLLAPPPPTVANAMATLIAYFKDSSSSPALPPLTIPPIGKVLSMLRAGQASADVYGELLKALSTTLAILTILSKSTTEYKNVIDALMILLEYESGMAANPESLRTRCIDTIKTIEDVVYQTYHTQYFSSNLSDNDSGVQESINDFSPIIPKGFLERNEAHWRCRVKQEAIPHVYARVYESAKILADAIATDFWLADNTDIKAMYKTKNPVIHDIFNNLLALREVPSRVENDSLNLYFHPKDRNGKVLKNRYTTERVQGALSDYLDACNEAASEITRALIKLSQTLHDEGHFPSIVQASHANLILSSSFYHAAKANSLGWNLVEMVNDEVDNAENNYAAKVDGIWPYWMSSSTAVKNSFEMKGMWLLTAPNMSGKSTIMRSIAAATLLTACGFCAPLDAGSRMRRFDHIFVRGASSDVPVERKSAFGAEMGDIAALFRCCGENSLVFVDELGRGTSPEDGTRLSAAILESMAQSGMSGIFATHLHGILSFTNLVLDRITMKRMAIDDREMQEKDNVGMWKYTLEDGICLDSMALVTAKHFGLPKSVIERANKFQVTVPSLDPKYSMVSSSNLTEKDNLDLQIALMVKDVTEKTSISIPVNWNVPASFDGCSSVYVLKISSNPSKFYVGESDNLRRRIQQHRSKGKSWYNLEAVAVVSADNKSQARTWEKNLIQKLTAFGMNVISTVDGR